MNFNNPKPILDTTERKKSNPVSALFEKITAVLSMISLAMSGATTKDNIAAKNIGIAVFIAIVAYFIGCGAWLNIQWLRDVHVSGEWFYYAGIPFLVFVSIELLNIEKKVREFSVEKKLMYPNRDSLLERIIGRNKTYNVISTLLEVLSFFWVIAGIIFYDRIIFIVLFCGAIFITASTTLFKKAQDARIIFFIESIFWILMLILILANHFMAVLNN